MPKNVPMPRSSWWLWLSLLFPAVRSLAVSLPGTFLEEKAFRRSSAAARTVSALRREAPRTFASAPDVAAFGAIFTEGVVLRGDLGQPLVRGREEYVRLFRQLAELNAAPLNPWRLGEVKTAFSAGLSADESSCNLLLVRWEVEVTVRSADGGGGVGGVGGGGVGGAKTPGSAVGTNLGIDDAQFNPGDADGAAAACNWDPRQPPLSWLVAPLICPTPQLLIPSLRALSSLCGCDSMVGSAECRCLLRGRVARPWSDML